TSAARAAEIINNLLQFSRPRKGETVVISPAEILDAGVALSLADYDLKKRYDIADIEIVREYDPELKSISCVAMEIEQVILNLLRNAAQALTEREDRADQARIILRTGKVNGKARIEVEDNGPGMDAETLRHAFDPFFTTKEVGEGTGLGLSVSHTIICDKHQGRMWVESEPGRGATFIIELPMNG
ncbi:MAG: ATP-binding protein, partial [Desulfobulbaceae bacterium]|nr:ATP-binding protein [Desulfobulbaceae bacterium]